MSTEKTTVQPRMSWRSLAVGTAGLFIALISHRTRGETIRALSENLGLPHKRSPFSYLETSPEILRLAVMLYIRVFLPLRNVEVIPWRLGIEITREAGEQTRAAVLANWHGLRAACSIGGGGGAESGSHSSDSTSLGDRLDLTQPGSLGAKMQSRDDHAPDLANVTQTERSGSRRSWRRPWSAALVIAIVSLWASGLVGVAGLALSTWGDEGAWRGRSLWLPEYQVDIDGQVVRGLVSNVSGLTFNAETGTLFTAINHPAELAELSSDGTLLRRISIVGGRDIEGITHVEGRRFIVVDEELHRLSWIEIDETTSTVDLQNAPSVTLDMGPYANMGFEGVSWDQERNTLMVAQEMWPIRVISFTGLDPTSSHHGVVMDIREWTPSGWAGYAMADLSSLTIHDRTGHVLLLSDLTSVMVEYSADGEPVSYLPLWRSWGGLDAKVPQAEGIAIGPDASIYVVSEPNLFYRFKRNSETP